MTQHLSWHPVSTRPDLLAEPVRTALEGSPLADSVQVAAIDPDLADTQALVDATDVTLEESANCIVVLGRRGEIERVTAALVLATTRADVNTTIRKSLDVRKASFMPMERAVTETAMEFGGITPVGLPADWPVLVDSRVVEAARVVIGSGIRGSKLRLPGASVARLPGVRVVEGLAR
ncbi:YbaK/EbsC family protein [Ornithinimicrobium cryptoxanthini]|uniref:YbaK/EbsC family protein n=1 Tax=Ornithinimicrobium cryptoxanthini TaxID=2934161 RepID=UPI002118BBED|nr:YbaK/EbsC family protein [Ornithinimicrobium cryptoxanthini]